MAANPEIAAYIRDAAIKRGINPDVALEVARREALNVFDPTKPDLGGDDRSSFGPFQLHYKGRSAKMPNAGLGDEFTAKTGLKADDPSTWKQQVDFSLDWAKTHGWGDWMGAAAAGITGMAGIDGKPVNFASTDSGGAPSGTSASATNSIQVPPKTDMGEALLYDLPRKTLADDLSASVSPKRISRGDSGTSGSAFSEGANDVVVDAPEFASAIPETPPPAPVTTPAGLAADDFSPLADIFQVGDIGGAAALDPRTGQALIPRSRRMYG